MKQNNRFPKNFLWGASTAGHQVEGGNVDQWSVWELAQSSELAKTAHKRLGWIPGWEKIAKQATSPQNYISGTGIDHYRRYKEDFKIAKSLNLNTLRFGVEWSRVEPEEGVWDKAAWEHYRAYISEMQADGLEPILNIWHWTMPTWFTDKGEFSKQKNLKYFDRFVAKLCKELQVNKLKYVITLNEPNVYASFGYLTGEWVPNEKKPLKALWLYWNLARAHKRAYRILKQANPKLQVGVASQLANIQAKRSHNPVDRVTTSVMRYLWNWWFLNRVRRYQDFVGFNYYFTDYFKGTKRDNPKSPVSELGWYMEPGGLYPVLINVWKRYKKPIIVTENGLADETDSKRQWWIQETMVAMERALGEGVDLRGYLHWSLLDNFEWAYGWWPKFGLIAVDREHGMKRTPRPSALWWAEELKNLKAK